VTSFAAEDMKWDEVEPSARDVFHVWTDSSCELDWAHHAWCHLERAGLTTYDLHDDADRCRVVARFVSLCNLYCDFVHVAWQESSSVEYGDVASRLHLEPASMLELARRSADWQDDPGAEAEDVLVDALKFASDTEHGTVVRALVEGFGGEDGFFCDLWRSHPEYHYQAFGEIMNDLTTDKMVAYEWVTAQGCDNLRSVRDGYE
jgi:hypothetical protein